MANLDVQRKKFNPWGWIIVIAVALAALFFLVRGCDSTKDNAARVAVASGY